jgi:hypothetical protein
MVRTQSLQCTLHALLGAAVDSDSSTFCGERIRDRITNTCGRAGNHSVLAIQLQIHVIFTVYFRTLF